MNRDKKITLSFLTGITMEVIALRYKISKQRVSQILCENGVSRWEGGASLRARKAKKRAKT